MVCGVLPSAGSKPVHFFKRLFQSRPPARGPSARSGGVHEQRLVRFFYLARCGVRMATNQHANQEPGQGRAGKEVFLFTKNGVATCAPKHQKPTKKSHVHSGIRTRNRPYAHVLVPRPLPPPSILVLAGGQNRKWALSFFFVYERFFRCVANPFSAVPPLTNFPVWQCACGWRSIGGFPSCR